jgi:hypothetical protein
MLTQFVVVIEGNVVVTGAANTQYCTPGSMVQDTVALLSPAATVMPPVGAGAELPPPQAETRTATRMAAKACRIKEKCMENRLRGIER